MHKTTYDERQTQNQKSYKQTYFMPLEYVGFLLTGAIAGLLAGLLGIGGGFVIVPACLLIFPMLGLPQEWMMHLAIATSLATICVTSLSSAWTHHKKKAVMWHFFWKLSPGIIIGALLVGWIASAISGQALQWIFGLGAILMAVQIWLGLLPSGENDHPHPISLVLVTGAIGGASALVGIGGGSLVVPYLMYLRQPIVKAVATAAACGFPIAVAGTVGYILSGWNVKNLPEGSLGFVYLPAFLGIIVTSILTAPLGAKLAHWLPAKTLKQVFAVFLALVGIKIILG